MCHFTVMSTSRRHKSASSNTAELTQVQDLIERVLALERAVAKSKAVLPSDPVSPATLNITPFVAKWEKSRLLQLLYPPRDDGSHTYTLNEYELGPDSVGYWPGENQWHGMYLGGCEPFNENRRALIIPLCLASNLDFFTPQGASTSSSDVAKRLQALENCSSAVIDFSHDELCLNYVPGFEVLYLFARGFVHVSFIQFPANIPTAILKFDESECISNTFGPWDSVTLRQRRQDYYVIIQALISAMAGWTCYDTINGPNGLEHHVVNYRAKFSRPKSEGVQIPVLSRFEVYRTLRSATFNTDIGATMRVILGMLILGEMHTRDFMDNHVAEWKHIRGEFADLQNRAALAATQLQDVDPTSFDDRHFHLQAFIDLVQLASAVLTNYRHLD